MMAHRHRHLPLLHAGDEFPQRGDVCVECCAAGRGQGDPGGAAAGVDAFAAVDVADTVTVTPRQARCADCQVTQILLPTALTVRRADSTEAIGTALVGHARGAGHRSIVTDLRPRLADRQAQVAPSGRRRTRYHNGVLAN